MSRSGYSSSNFFADVTSDDACLLIFQYLNTNETLRLSETCKRCALLGGRDEIWRPLCFRDYHISKLSDLPPISDRYDDEEEVEEVEEEREEDEQDNDIVDYVAISRGRFSQSQRYKDLYATWIQTFYGEGVTQAEVKMAWQWWQRMERWLGQHAPQILATLNPPASRDVIDEVESQLDEEGKILPPIVKLLYRFHDGQNLVAIGPGQNHETEKAFISSTFYGLFGGYNFYNELVNVRLLPLRHVHYATIMQLRLQGDRPPDYAYITPPTSLAMTLEEESRLDHTVVFACDDAFANVKKFISAGFVGNSLVPQVFTNCNGSTHVISCLQNDAKVRAANSPGGELFAWLEEYLQRLERGVYQMQPVDLTRPHEMHRPIPRSRALQMQMISLYPVPEETIAYDPTGSAVVASSTVTVGVQAAVSPLFIPHMSSVRSNLPPSDGNEHGSPPRARHVLDELFWSYSVRLRLLRDHPDRPEHLNCCQLTRRHWEFTRGDRNVVSESVTGPGVIGLFPLLDTAYSQPRSSSSSRTDGSNHCSSTGSMGGTSDWPWPFAYQSCTTTSSRVADNTMRGWLEFKISSDIAQSVHIPAAHVSAYGGGGDDDDDDDGDGLGRDPSDTCFRAAVGEFRLAVPDYIF